MSENIVIIVLDSVRADHCSLYNYNKETTPCLSALSSVKFENAYANAPYTAASVPSLLSSRYPLEDDHIVYNDFPIIPEYLSDTEYTTAVAYNNAQITRWGYNTHFDVEIDLSSSASNSKSSDNNRSSHLRTFVDTVRDMIYESVNDNERLASHLGDIYYRLGVNEETIPHSDDGVVLSKASELVDSLPEPYFVYIHLMNTHNPYVFDAKDFEDISADTFNWNKYQRLLSHAQTHVTPGEYVWDLSEEEHKYVQTAYDASIRNVDRKVAEFVSEIRGDQTRFFVTSDHGEELWERGHWAHSASPSKPRKMTLYDEMIHVPLLMIPPSDTNSTVDTPVMLADLLPTVLDIAGVHTKEPLRGTSLNTIVDTDDDKSKSRTIISHATSPSDPQRFYESDDSTYFGCTRVDTKKLHHLRVSSI